MSVLKGYFKFSFLIFIIISTIGTLLSDDQDLYVYMVLERKLNKELHYYRNYLHLNNLKYMPQNTAYKLQLKYFEAKERLKELKTTRDLGFSYSEEFYKYLNEYYLPTLEQILKKHDITPDKKYWSEHIENNFLELERIENELFNTYQQISCRHPKIKLILQNLAFSRSETLGSGMIGHLHPDGTEAHIDSTHSAEIQKTTLRGLVTVIKMLNDPTCKHTDMSLRDMRHFHKILLGNAEHQYSKRGEILHRQYQDYDSSSRSTYSYIKELFAGEMRWRKPGLLTSNEYYNQILKIHAFGDSNGRLAEVAKQIILEKANLPPLLTREKTAIENYYYQSFFGRGDFIQEMINISKETIDFIKKWDDLLGECDQILDVKMVGGGNVVVKVKYKDQYQFIVLNKTYLLGDNVSDLPPVQGQPVLVGRGIYKAQIVYTLKNKNEYTPSPLVENEMSPLTILDTKRQGEVIIKYPFYVIDLGPVNKRVSLRFYIYYIHPNGDNVKFNNGGRYFWGEL